MNLSRPSPAAPDRRACLQALAGGALLGLGAGRAAAAPASPAACPALLQMTLKRLQDEAPVPLCQHAGKVLLVVNTASRCGYTPQFEALETLHRRHAAQGLVVMGFPSHDFFQELGNNQAIAEFCRSTYDVRFPMFAPGPVRGKDAQPFYAELIRRSGEAPRWNFHKYLIARDGQTILSRGTRTDPLGPAFLADLEKLINAK